MYLFVCLTIEPINGVFIIHLSEKEGGTRVLDLDLEAHMHTKNKQIWLIY